MAIVTFSLDRAPSSRPQDPASLVIPAKPDRAIKAFLGASPYIETRHRKIVKLAKATGDGLEGWAKVEKIYDTVPRKGGIPQRRFEGPLRGRWPTAGATARNSPACSSRCVGWKAFPPHRLGGGALLSRVLPRGW